MKKLSILLSIFILIGCSESTNSVSNPDPENPEAKGGVALTFSNSNAKSNIASKDLPDPSNVRVLIRRFENDNLQFNALADVEVPTDTTIIIEVPAKDNYQIDAFSYIDSTRNLKPILKVDQNRNIAVTADDVTQVNLQLQPVTPTFTIPDSVKRGNNFSITANFDDFLPVPVSYDTQYLSYLKVDSNYVDNFNNGRSDYFDGYSSSENANEAILEWNEISISEFSNKNSYFQVITKLTADQFYKSNEDNGFSFVFNYPNPYSSDTLKTFVKTPEGGIGIDIEY